MFEPIKVLWTKLTTRAPAPAIKKEKAVGFLNSDVMADMADKKTLTNTQIDLIMARNFQRKLTTISPAGLAMDVKDAKTPNGFTMDDMEKAVKNVMTAQDATANLPQLSGMVASWFASQSFIGYQMCAILAQQWLISKACSMPGEDAVRKGWEVTLDDGTPLTPEQNLYIKQRDIELGVSASLREYITFSRIFGVRVAIFLLNSENDPKFYENPFNPDGIKQGSYTGISQIDPYWMAAELDMSASADPVNRHFYEPTWWRMGNLKAHRSHLCTLIPNPVPDVMKPTYFFGGVPLTQQIYERVYNGEACANEAVQLLQTKRCNVLFGDLSLMLAKQAKTEERLSLWARLRDNYGVKVMGAEERYEQHDTTLADLDSTILTQYELAAAIAGIPSTKLLGHAPSGSLAQTGEGEEANYHEMLESMQNNDLTPVLTRHYLCLSKSELEHKWPELKGKKLCVSWPELDAMTEDERAGVNLKKAQTDQALRDVGAIDGDMVRDRIIKDPDSGYTGIKIEPEQIDDMDDDDDLVDDQPDNDDTDIPDKKPDAD